jgi:hypothetical protein
MGYLLHELAVLVDGDNFMVERLKLRREAVAKPPETEDDVLSQSLFSLDSEASLSRGD